MSTDIRPARPAWWATPRIRLVFRLAMLVGLALGVETVVLHLLTDPLADVHAYYDAGARLNAGQPLYDQPAGDRRRRVLPLPAAARDRLPAARAAAVRRRGRDLDGRSSSSWSRRSVRIDLRRPVTLFVVSGCSRSRSAGASSSARHRSPSRCCWRSACPWAVALAANLKVFPILAAIWWLGRRDWRCVRAGSSPGSLGLASLQLVLEPAGTLAYPGVPPARPGRRA